MDPSVMYMYLTIRNKQRKRRRWSVHPINSVRHSRGAFYTLYEELRVHGENFFNYFRMSVVSFDELCAKVRNTIACSPNLVKGLGFQPEEMIAVTIRYLASGSSFTELHYAYRMGITTISIIVKRMCKVIWKTLNREVFLSLDCSENVWREIADDFSTRSNFPHCIGALDGKHLRVIKPAHSASMFYNYKNYFSILLFAVCDSNYKFLYIDVGSYGREADPTVFNCSTFGRKVQEGSLNLPPPESVSNGLMPLPYVFLGDDAFGISINLMKPYGGNNLTRTQRIYNYRVCRARRYIECSFGILSNKWRVFHRPLNTDVDVAISVVKTCCALHNFVRVRDGVRFEDLLDVTGIYDITEENENFEVPRGPKKAYQYRNAYAQYFVSTEGSVPWQNRFC